MIPRPDLLDARSPAGLEVFQLTNESVPSTHIYTEAQVFPTNDSTRFVLHRSATPHGSDHKDPEHRYLLCDLRDRGRLMPVTDEIGATAPSVSPDGKFLYYLVNQTETGASGRLTLCRRNLDGTDPQTILVIDGPLPGTRFRLSRIYPLSTISSDGKRLAISGFLGDGRTPGSPWGLIVFDLERATSDLILHGPAWCNMHPQYSRSLDPAHARDILIQENHGCGIDAAGDCHRLVGGRGADIHVIRDDGMNLRDMPWGRDGDEQCQGHQCWRGRSDWAITTTLTASVDQCQLIESRAVPHFDHEGSRTPGDGVVRNHLSRDFPNPQFYHFATDIAGEVLVTDCGPMSSTGALYFGALGAPGKDALIDLTYLLTPRTTWQKGSHMHPFLSPDGRIAFFNSDESGTLQAYMIRGLPKVGHAR